MRFYVVSDAFLTDESKAVAQVIQLLQFLEPGQRIGREVWNQITEALDLAGRMTHERQEMFQARMFLDALAKVSPDGAVIQRYVADLENRVADLTAALKKPPTE